jgi:Fur family ferric uptake transcriptional regulator
MEIIGNSPSPLSHQEILNALGNGHAINRVTLYRILDLLVEHDLVSRLSSGDRAFRYGLAPNALHPRHPHFYCRKCGHMECLEAPGVELDPETLRKLGPARILDIEVRIDGICGNCSAGGRNGGR